MDGKFTVEEIAKVFGVPASHIEPGLVEVCNIVMKEIPERIDRLDLAPFRRALTLEGN